MSGRVTDEATKLLADALDAAGYKPGLASKGGFIPCEPAIAAIQAALEAAAPHMREGEQMAESRRDVPEGLVVRIESAIQRIHEGHACMRIPADHNDPDLVLADVLSWVTSNAPPKADAVDLWQPIETAAKDGTTWLLMHGHGETFIGIRPTGCPNDAAADMMGTACYPTHWQPLPTPPIDSSRSKP